MPHRPSVPNFIGLFIYLSPFIPLSFKGEGEELDLKGLCPS